MNKSNMIQSYLKEYKFNKARINFLESQMKRFPGGEDDRYAVTGFTNLPDFEEALDILIPGHGIGLKHVGMVKEGVPVYGFQQADVLVEFENEVNKLKYMTGVVEDALFVLEGIDQKYRMIIEEHYINGNRMEDVAELIHVGKSRCYELRKEAFEWIVRVISGEGLCKAALSPEVSAEKHGSGQPLKEEDTSGQGWKKSGQKADKLRTTSEKISATI